MNNKANKRDGLLVIYGEIALRKDNRAIYENRLFEQILSRIADYKDYYMNKEQGRFIILPHKEFDYELIVPAVVSVFGIVAVCPCTVLTDNSIDNIREHALVHMKKFHSKKTFTFKAEARRADKRYPLTSNEIAAEVGGYVHEHMDNSTVDVHEPEVRLKVEIRNRTYIFSKAIKGFGGLPYASTGKAALMLSGGIDSPVAGFLAAKRGVEITAVFFDSPPFTSPRATEKVKDLAKRLAFYTGGLTLYVVPFTEILTMLNERVPIVKLTIFLKRAMIRATQLIAESENANGIILGDAIGQVASQTMHSIQAVNSAASLPLLRPLSGMDKQEIIDLARKIGTFDISIRPYDDCCTVFVAKNPETKPKASVIETMETKIDTLLPLIESAVSRAEKIEF